MVNNLLVDDTKFNLAKERGNSTVLRRYRVNNPEVISRVVDFLYDELVCYYDLNGHRKSTVDKLNVAASRAKEAIYVVGNRQLWREAGFFQELDKRLP